MSQPILRTDSHTISLLVANKPGVLVRIALVFSRRGFNIESLVVSPDLDGRFSRMTITARGDRSVLEQIIKQAAKLVDVVSANEHEGEHVEKELALIKISIKDEQKRAQLLQIVHHFKAETVDLAQESLVIQATGSTKKLDAMIEMLSAYTIKEIVRTGKVLMARGKEKT